jgi:hypothetical protein
VLALSRRQWRALRAKLIPMGRMHHARAWCTLGVNRTWSIVRIAIVIDALQALCPDGCDCRRWR